MAYDAEDVDLQARIWVRGFDPQNPAELVETTVGRVLFNEVVPMELRPVNKELKKKEVTQLVGDCYHRLGNAETVKFLDDLKDIGFRYASLSGLSIGIDDMKTPPSKKDLIEQARRQVFEVDAAVPGRRHHQRRALQQGGRHLGPCDRGHRGRDVPRARGGRAAGGVQPDLHDGRLGGPGLEAADPAAGRHARAHGEAVGRDHRDADHVELPRGAHRARVLHLDARRPQGSGRHRAQDGRLGLPHAAAGGRGPGRHHQRAGLRDGQVHRRDAAGRGRRDHPVAQGPRAGAGRGGGHPRSLLGRGHRAGGDRDRRGLRDTDRGCRARASQDPLRAHL